MVGRRFSARTDRFGIFSFWILVSGFWLLGFIRGVNPPLILTLQFWITATFTVSAVLVGLGLIPNHAARVRRALQRIGAIDLPMVELSHSFAHLAERPPDQGGDVLDRRSNPVDGQMAVWLALVHV